MIVRVSRAAWANVAAALFVFNPASIYVSAYWGQVDSVPAGFVLAALALLLYRRSAAAQARAFVIAAWLSIAYAILIKPPAVMIALLMLRGRSRPRDAGVRRRRLIGTGWALPAAVLLAILRRVRCSTRAVRRDRVVVRTVRYGSAVYPYNSVNAFNLHSLFRPFWQPDTVPIAIGLVLTWSDVGVGDHSGRGCRSPDLRALPAAAGRRGVSRSRMLLSLAFLHARNAHARALHLQRLRAVIPLPPSDGVSDRDRRV